MEGTNVYNQITPELAIEADRHEPVRTTVLSTFICPSAPGEYLFEIAERDGHHHEHSRGSEGSLIDDEGEMFFWISKSDYVGVFGTFEIDEAA